MMRMALVLLLLAGGPVPAARKGLKPHYRAQANPAHASAIQCPPTAAELELYPWRPITCYILSRMGEPPTRTERTP